MSHQQLGFSWRGPTFGRTLEVATWGLRRSVLERIPPSVIDLERSGAGLRALLGGAEQSSVGRIQWGTGFELELQDDDRLTFENEQGEARQVIEAQWAGQVE